MLYIVDHHNSFTTAIHTRQLAPDDALLLIQGLRFYQNVYLNYQKDDDLFDADGCPSWKNQDCNIYMYYKDEWLACIHTQYSGYIWQKLTAKPNLEEPELNEPNNTYRWHWHDIS